MEDHGEPKESYTLERHGVSHGGIEVFSKVYDSLENNQGTQGNAM